MDPEKARVVLDRAAGERSGISDVVKYNRENGVIVGFGDMSPNGYPDRFMYTGTFSGAARRARYATSLNALPAGG